jgi:phage tail sheath gpL-like
MAISTGIPLNWNLPLFWANVSGAMAGNLTEQEPACLVGQYDASWTGGIGAGGANILVAVGSPALGAAMFGPGSMLSAMVNAFFAVNTTQLLYCLPVSDPAAGVHAAGSITFTNSTPSSGVWALYIADVLVQWESLSTDSGATCAADCVAAINAVPNSPVTASLISSGGDGVALTCNWKGLTGNDILIGLNYLGTNGGQSTPAGWTATIVQPTAGAGEPVFTTAISNIQAIELDYVAMPYTDSGSMTVWSNEYGFSSSGRWNYTRQQYGFIVNAMRDDYSDAITWGSAQNSPVMSTMIVEQGAPSPMYSWAAQYCGLAALGFTDDPARPLQTLEFITMLPAPLQNRFSQGELNNLTNSGFAVQGVAPSGNPMILREQTQYQFNSYGQGDTAFGLLTVLATLQELLKRMKAAITTKYPRVKLVPDGTKLGPGQAAVTPSIIKGELVAEFVAAMYDGLVADQTDFVNNLVVEIDDNNPNRIDVLWPPQLAGQLRQFTALAQFRLMYPPVALS